MKTIKQFSILLILIIFISLTGRCQETGQEKFYGNWSGSLDVAGTKLEMIFKITFSEAGGLEAKLDVPQQVAYNIPASKISINEDSLIINIDAINGNFKGKYSGEQEIIGNWEQNGMSFPMTLSKTESTEINRPQTPIRPFPYKEEEVTFTNQKDNINLSGTLTIPSGEAKFPAVVLITGSGAQDRDETIFEHKPFLVLADYLTRNGIAVLRTDDRGVGSSEGNIRDATTEGLAEDVLAGIDFLKNHPNINSSKIGLLGHSEGGIIAPITANLSGDVQFIILLAGSGIPGEQLLYEQGELINRAAGLSEDLIQQNRELQSEIFKIIINEKDLSIATEELQQAYSRGMFQSLNEEQKMAINQRIESVNTPWMKFFLEYDPYPALSKVKCPVLALIGEKDLQVPPKSNLTAIENALTEGKNNNYKVLELKNLNHLFQNCNTGSITEYVTIEETIAPIALETINSWILEIIQ